MVFFDRIFKGSDEMFAKAEHDVNAVVAELGPDAEVKMPNTAYYHSCCYSFLVKKITTLGELQAVLADIKAMLKHEQNTDSVFSSGIATAIAAEVIEARARSTSGTLCASSAFRSSLATSPASSS